MRTLAILPIINIKKDALFFMRNYKESFNMRNTDFIFILKDPSRKTKENLRDIFYINKKDIGSFTDRISYTGNEGINNIGVIAIEQGKDTISSIINRLIMYIEKTYDHYLIAEPNIFFTLGVIRAFNVFRLSKRMDCLFIPSEGLDRNDLISINFEKNTSVIEDFAYRDLDNPKEDSLFMLFKDPMYRYYKYRVIICRRYVFEKLKYRGFAPQLNKGYVDALMGTPALLSTVNPYYMQIFSTFHVTE